MLKKFLITLVGVALIVGAIVYAKVSQFGAMIEAGANMVLPPETVTAMSAQSAQWEQWLSATGTVSAVQGVVVSTETSGRVEQIEFESGAAVNAGDVLVRLDISTEEAQLAAARAAAALATAELARARELLERKMVSAAELDTADAQAKEARAQVVNVGALIAKKTIRAPFAGRLGLRRINLGQILSQGDAIVSLQTLDPIHINFSLPQQDLPRLHTGMEVRLTADAAPGESFVGKINAISPEVDSATRTVRVQALTDNAQEKLRDGMFVNVRVVLPKSHKVLPVSLSAVLYAPYGDSVFVIEEKKNEDSGAVDKVLRQQFVQLGQARGDFVDVLDGLKAGETVVTSGVFKLRSGMVVVVDNKLAPKPELDPKPGDS